MKDFLLRRIAEIEKIATESGWVLIDHQDNINMLSFLKDRSRINVYYTKMTVTTCINHPTKGRTQLFRRGVNIEELKKIFKTPRLHTKKGYYYKNV